MGTRSPWEIARCKIWTGSIVEIIVERLFVFSIKLGEAIREHQGVATCVIFVAIRDEFATKEHPVIAEGIADDVATTRKSKHQSQTAGPEPFDDFTATGERGLPTPSSQMNVVAVEL